jgi:hypothetical protein
MASKKPVKKYNKKIKDFLLLVLFADTPFHFLFIKALNGNALCFRQFIMNFQ